MVLIYESRGSYDMAYIVLYLHIIFDPFIILIRMIFNIIYYNKDIGIYVNNNTMGN